MDSVEMLTKKLEKRNQDLARASAQIEALRFDVAEISGVKDLMMNHSADLQKKMEALESSSQVNLAEKVLDVWIATFASRIANNAIDTSAAKADEAVAIFKERFK